MKISTNTLRFINEHYGSAGDPAPSGVDELVTIIGLRLAAVEEVVPFGDRFEGVLIVRVVACADHPDAERLHVCTVDDGGKASNVERDDQGYVQVVCGAPNIRAGMFAAWLPPGATVPNTYATKDPFVLEARPLRGIVSNGMLASPKELGLGDNHDGILEITLDSDEHPAPGTAFADAYHLRGDHIIDMENKMFTHRPDCFGYLGIARELEGIQHRAYRSPEWYTLDPDFPDAEAEPLELRVTNEIPELVPRFTAVALRGVQVKPSPMWLQIDLARAGIRPINNIVDYTNFFMLETGQPIHAYDYDKVKSLSSGDGAHIVVRHPRDGEQITLLNGKTITPREQAMMVATDTQLICMGGAMGGTNTEVDEHTTNLIIEAANWDMYAMRRTAMEHGIFTDAVTRFTKGQSPLQNKAVVAKIVDEIRRFAEGAVASPLIDDNHLPHDVQERGSVHPPVVVSTRFINERLGLHIEGAEMQTLLTNVEFEVAVDNDTLTVKAPFWRTDIAIPEDVVEEVGRLYGYDRLPLALPKRGIAPAVKDPMLSLESKVRDILRRAGANEVLSYSFVHSKVLDKVGQDKAQAFQLSNALSPDLQYFRLSLTPSLLDKVYANNRAGHDEFALFEINKVHSKTELDEEGLPIEFMRIALVVALDDKAAADSYAGAPYYLARKYATDLLGHLGMMPGISWQSLADAEKSGVFADHPMSIQMATVFEPARSAVILHNNTKIGIVGEYRQNVRRALKLPAMAAGFELYASALLQGKTQQYVQLPRFPKVEQDICLKVPMNVPYDELFRFVWTHLDQNRPDQTYHMLGPVDIYQRPDDTAHKQITLRLSIASYERTLTDSEVNTLLDRVADAAHEQLGAERV